MIKRNDLQTYEVVLALFTISHCADMMFDEIAEDDLPDSIRSGYIAVRSSISSLIESLDQYREEKIDAFTSACEE